MTDAALEQDVLTKIDFDFSPPCEATDMSVNVIQKTVNSVGEPCGDTAVWIMRFTLCCEKRKEQPVAYYCDRHRAEKLAQPHTCCPLCFMVFMPPVLGYISIERL